MINSYEDLKAQRAQAHNDLQVAKSKLSEDTRIWQEEVKPLKAVSSIASNMFSHPFSTKSKEGLVGTGVQVGINALLGKTLLRRLPTPLNVVVPHVLQNAAINYTKKNGRDWLIRGLRWVKNITEEKPDNVQALVVVEEPVETVPVPVPPVEPLDQVRSAQ